MEEKRINNMDITKEEARLLIGLLCNEQIKMVKDNPKQEIYKSDRYLKLEEIKVKCKNVR